MPTPFRVDGLLEKQRRAIILKHSLMDFGYLLDERYRTPDPDEIIATFKLP